MATGIETYHAIRAARGRGIGIGFLLAETDALDLQKLTASALVEAGYDEGIADDAISAMRKGDYEPLGRTMAVKFGVRLDAASVVDN